MNTSFLKILPLLLGSIALTAQALPITGQVNIQAGSVVLVPNSLGAVTSVGASGNGHITSVSGDYPSTLFGAIAAYKTFNVVLGSQPITSLWSVTDPNSGFGFSFDLMSIVSIVQTQTNLFIDGTGSLDSTNPALSSAPGFWSYGINSANGAATNGIFSFQSNNVAQNQVPVVPESGSSLMLIGAGLMGLAGFGRFFFKSALTQQLC